MFDNQQVEMTLQNEKQNLFQNGNKMNKKLLLSMNCDYTFQK